MQHPISGWAYRHASVAIALIVLLEVINGCIGTLLGANLLADAPVAVSQALIAALIGMVFYIRLWYARTAVPDGRREQTKRRCLYLLFLGNFLLFVGLGGVGANQTRVFHPSAAVAGTDLTVSASVDGDSLKPRASVSPAERAVKFRRGVPLVVIILEYLLLFGISFYLVALLMYLSCSLACSGHGFWAIVVLLLGLGVVGGIITGLGRVLQNQWGRRRLLARRRRAAR